MKLITLLFLLLPFCMQAQDYKDAGFYLRKGSNQFAVSASVGVVGGLVGSLLYYKGTQSNNTSLQKVALGAWGITGGISFMVFISGASNTTKAGYKLEGL